jgi:UDPglucose 6-dehydrogenase
VSKVAIFGLWHLGCVTAACLAEAGIPTIGIDPDVERVAALKSGRAPLAEPGLDDLIASSAGLSFTTDPAAVSGCHVVWITIDTPVDDDDRADVASVIAAVETLFPFLDPGSVVLVSSQVPVGSTGLLARRFAHARPGVAVHFAYSPENLRLGRALDAFKHAERIVIGVNSTEARDILSPILARFSDQLVWVSVESAEMTKHAVNAFLATCVTFANEVARVCERVGADAAEVERALRLEPRIGPKAYIRPGGPFAGGTLARDIFFLGEIATQNDVEIPMLGAVLDSNAIQKTWPIQRLVAELGSLEGTRIGLLGLAYKVGTSTLRRSWAIELARSLAERGATVIGFDPEVSSLDPGLAGVLTLADSAASVLEDADAVIVTTEWPAFAALEPAVFQRMKQALVLDPNRFLGARLGQATGLRYVSVGSP